MAIAIATIRTNIWDTILGYVNHSSVTNLAKIVGSYAKSYTKNASNKDFVVLHNPRITQDILTMTKKQYPVSMEIEVVCSENEQLKVIVDAVCARIDANKANARSDALFDLEYEDREPTPELRDGVRILHFPIVLTATYRGAS